LKGGKYGSFTNQPAFADGDESSYYTPQKEKPLLNSVQLRCAKEKVAGFEDYFNRVKAGFPENFNAGIIEFLKKIKKMLKDNKGDPNQDPFSFLEDFFGDFFGNVSQEDRDNWSRSELIELFEELGDLYNGWDFSYQKTPEHRPQFSPVRFSPL
jgi:hypothetical protein